MRRRQRQRGSGAGRGVGGSSVAPEGGEEAEAQRWRAGSRPQSGSGGRRGVSGHNSLYFHFHIH